MKVLHAVAAGAAGASVRRAAAFDDKTYHPSVAVLRLCALPSATVADFAPPLLLISL